MISTFFFIKRQKQNLKILELVAYSLSSEDQRFFEQDTLSNRGVSRVLNYLENIKNKHLYFQGNFINKIIADNDAIAANCLKRYLQIVLATLNFLFFDVKVSLVTQGMKSPFKSVFMRSTVFTGQKVKIILSKLIPHKSRGPDGIGNLILKHAAKIIFKPLFF